MASYHITPKIKEHLDFSNPLRRRDIEKRKQIFFTSITYQIRIIYSEIECEPRTISIALSHENLSYNEWMI